MPIQICLRQRAFSPLFMFLRPQSQMLRTMLNSYNISILEDTMDLKQMEYFKTIVDQGSINQAAKILHMSQPPLSMSIKKLEEELGTLLLIRGNKHISLTEAGKIFYQRSCSILELADSTASEVSKAGSQRTFALGLTPSTIPVVSEMLAQFSDAFPEVKYRIYDGSTLELSHLLDTGGLDAAFLRTPFATGDLKL